MTQLYLIDEANVIDNKHLLDEKEYVELFPVSGFDNTYLLLSECAECGNLFYKIDMQKVVDGYICYQCLLLRTMQRKEFHV